MASALRGKPAEIILIASLITSASACSGSRDEDDEFGRAVPIARCQQYPYRACDISKPECHQSSFGLVKCLRETPQGYLPPVLTITASEYRSLLTQGAANVDRSELRRQEVALVLLGLLSSGDLTVSKQVDLLVDTVPAFYSSEAKKIVIVAPDASQSAAAAEARTQSEDTLMLAHEFVHALQDQSYDLTQFLQSHSETDDATLASRSVAEGEAELYETVLRVAFSGLPQGAVHYPEHFTNGAQFAMEYYASEPPYLIANRIFPYFYGARYAYFQLTQVGRPALDALFATPPTTTLPFILSETGIVSPLTSPVLEPAPTAIRGSALIWEDSLGPWFTYQYLSRVSNTPLEAAQAVAGWRGDRIWAYGDTTTENVAVIWRVRWSSLDEASAFAQRTNLASPQFSGIAQASRQAFAFQTDTFVLATAGAFDADRASWLATAQLRAGAGDADGAGTGDVDGAGTGGGDAGSPLMATASSAIDAGSPVADAGTSHSDAGVAAAHRPRPGRILLSPVPRVFLR